MTDELFFEKTCPVCGKKFCLPSEGRLAYRVKMNRGGEIYLCSWHCQLAQEKRQTARRKINPTGKTLIPDGIHAGKLKKMRISAGYSQKKISELIGISSMTYRQYDYEELTPTEQTLRKIANVLGCTAEELRRKK